MGNKHGTNKFDSVSEDRMNLSVKLLKIRNKNKSLMVNMTKRVLIADADPQKLTFFMLPDAAVELIVAFLCDEIKTLMRVSPVWYVKLSETLDSIFSPIESHFSVVYSQFLLFKTSFISTGEIKVVGKHGNRVDRVIVAETLPRLINTTMKIRFTYRNYHDDRIYCSEYKFDVCDTPNRPVWVHRDESKVHSEENLKAYTLQIPMICKGDNIEFSINWLNLTSAIRLNTIQWQAPILQDTHLQLRSLQLKYNLDRSKKCEGIEHKTFMYNISRHCEVQLSQTEWYKADYYTKQHHVFSYDFFRPFLRCVKSKFAGVDLINSKFEYVAECAGIVPESFQRIGMMIEVKGKESELTNEVKRLGLLYDRYRSLELRVGDTFVLYITRGGN